VVAASHASICWALGVGPDSGRRPGPPATEQEARRRRSPTLISSSAISTPIIFSAQDAAYPSGVRRRRRDSRQALGVDAIDTARSIYEVVNDNMANAAPSTPPSRASISGIIRFSPSAARLRPTHAMSHDA
jgi:hypothetical protein